MSKTSNNKRYNSDWTGLAQNRDRFWCVCARDGELSDFKGLNEVIYSRIFVMVEKNNYSLPIKFQTKCFYMFFLIYSTLYLIRFAIVSDIFSCTVSLPEDIHVYYVEIKRQLDATDDIYCRFYCFLNIFRAPLCPSSGAREYYTDGRCLWYLVLWFSSCWYVVELRVMCPFCGQQPAKRTDCTV